MGANFSAQVINLQNVVYIFPPYRNLLWVFYIYDNQMEECTKQFKGWNVKMINGSSQGTVQRVRVWQQILATGLCLFFTKSHLGQHSCKASAGEYVVVTVLSLTRLESNITHGYGQLTQLTSAQNRSFRAVAKDWKQPVSSEKLSGISSWQLFCVITLWARKGTELPAEVSSLSPWSFLSSHLLNLLRWWKRKGRGFGVTVPLCPPKLQKRD